MDNFYGEQNRNFQDEFGTRKMADLLKEVIFNTEFDEDNKTFIEGLSSFFLTTIDHQGRPTVSVSYTHLDVYKRQIVCLWK